MQFRPVTPTRLIEAVVRRFKAQIAQFKETPHAVGLGLAAGVFAAFLPIVGLQMVTAALLARMARASVGAAVLGTFAGNPLTWPVMWLGSYKLGSHLLGTGSTLSPSELEEALQRLGAAAAQAVPDVIVATVIALWSVLKPLTIGSLPLGLLAGVLFYYIARRTAEMCKPESAPL